MKVLYVHLKYSILWMISVGLLIGCASTIPKTELSIQHPAKLSLKREIRKVFIDPAFIQNTNDKLGIKNQVIEALQKRLNDLGRFEVAIGPVKGIDEEKDTVALIQGSIVSGELVEDGQYSEVATCKGGIAGFVGGATGIKATKQGVTVSRRGLLCKVGNITTAAAEVGVSALFSLAGIEESRAPVDEVIRIYKYKNISIFAQVSFSITELGKTREMITIRSDSANFGRQIIESAKNVHESYVSLADALQLLLSPVAPLHYKRYALASETNRGSARGNWVNYIVPKASSIPAKERKLVIKQLVIESLKPFIRTISPYRVRAYITIDESGNESAVSLIKKQKWKKARGILEKIRSREAADEYNYGLTFEGGAESADDYRDAKKYYFSALNMDSSKMIYAQGVGRMERRLREYKKIQDQLN
ncbi:MAG: hypothetical protein HOD92_23610 [Deltaproteobacteria bacterium]|jgi:hypothetical protein|nr:hypothetical protein [Deltaproteobacteria bacterium]MBT4524953.1 hypothetical protein [Deltaproteobacteria bacterium]